MVRIWQNVYLLKWKFWKQFWMKVPKTVTATLTMKLLTMEAFGMPCRIWWMTSFLMTVTVRTGSNPSTCNGLQSMESCHFFIYFLEQVISKQKQIILIICSFKCVSPDLTIYTSCLSDKLIRQTCMQHSLLISSKVHAWVETDQTEMKKFIGSLMMIVIIPAVNSAWINELVVMLHQVQTSEITSRQGFIYLSES